MATGSPAWWNHLSFRITAVTVAATLIVIGAFVAAGIRAQQERLTDEVTRGARLFSDTIRSSTHNHMLRDEKEEAYRVMERIGGLRDIERVRIFNGQGRVTFSTVRSEIGNTLDVRSEACAGCHTGGGRPVATPTPPIRTFVYRSADGHRIMGMITPIYNEEACSRSGCHVHAGTQRVLGGIDIGMSLKTIDEGIASLRWRTLTIGALAILALSLVVWSSARQVVAKPVRELVDATGKIARGELDYAIPVRRPDEIGQLAESFNRMRESLARARVELAELMAGLEQQVEDRTAALKSAQAQLIQGEKLASLGKLSASIAHEINNPLAGILTSSKLIIRNLESQAGLEGRDDYLRQLRLIHRETERCSAIVRNLLDFARQRPVSLTDVQLNAAVEESLSLVSHQIELQGIRLVRDLDGAPVIRADYGQVRQACVNIILNACDAMNRGGTLTVQSRIPPGGSVVELVFIDTGVGIAEQDLLRIFDPFFTTKERGTGLGLSVVYGIIERIGGSIDVRSKVGTGTTVTIRFPLSQPPTATPA